MEPDPGARRLHWITLGVAVVALGVSAYSVHTVRELDAQIRARPAPQVPSAPPEASRAPSAPPRFDSPPAAVLPPQPPERPVARERVPRPDRDELARSVFRRRLEAAFPEETMDEETRERVVDLLGEIRALRAQTGGHGLGDDTPPELADALYESQQELIDLTGLGVAELLEQMHRPEERALRPHEARGVDEGDVRKRFADDLARQLGVAEPGQVEVYEDGEWVER